MKELVDVIDRLRPAPRRVLDSLLATLPEMLVIGATIMWMLQ